MKEPAFLQRMRRAAAGCGQPDRYIAPRNRKTAVEDGEDAPAYVMEDGQAISQEEFERMGGVESDDEEGGEKVAEKGEDGEVKTAEVEDSNKKALVEEEEEEERQEDLPAVKIAEVGGLKKRKAARIVGGEADEDEVKPPGPKKPVKGKRRVKLTFGDDE